MITIDRTFRASILIKGVSGVLETLGGILFIVIGSAGLTSLAGTVATALTTGPVPAGLSADITTAITRLAALSAWYAAVYLLAHGLVKLALVWAVLAGKLWAFPWMMTFLAGFIAFQSYRFVLAFSWGLLLLTLFDAFVLVLTGIEYRKRRNEHDARSLSTPLSRVGR